MPKGQVKKAAPKPAAEETNKQAKNDSEVMDAPPVMVNPVKDKIKPKKKAKKTAQRTAQPKVEEPKEEQPPSPKVTELVEKKSPKRSPDFPGMSDYNSESDEDYDPKMDKSPGEECECCRGGPCACKCAHELGEEEEESEEDNDNEIITMIDNFVLSPSEPEFTLRLVPNQYMKVAKMSLGRNNVSTKKHIIEMFFHYDPYTQEYEDSCTIERLIPGVVESSTPQIEMSYLAQCIKFVLGTTPDAKLTDLGEVEVLIQYTVPKSDLDTFFNFPGGEEEEEEEEEEEFFEEEEDSAEETEEDKVDVGKLKGIKKQAMEVLSKQPIKPGQPLKKRQGDSALEEMQSSKKVPAASTVVAAVEKTVKRDGVEYTTIGQGKGPSAKSGDLVRIAFVTKAIEANGTEKIIEETPSGKFANLKLGSPETAKFMTSGITGMKAGERRELKVPVRVLKAEKSTNVPADHPLKILLTLLEINPKARTDKQ